MQISSCPLQLSSPAVRLDSIKHDAKRQNAEFLSNSYGKRQIDKAGHGDHQSQENVESCARSRRQLSWTIQGVPAREGLCDSIENVAEETLADFLRYFFRSSKMVNWVLIQKTPHFPENVTRT